MTLSARKENFTSREIAGAEDLTNEAEMITDDEGSGEVIELTQAMRRDVIEAKDRKLIRESVNRDIQRLKDMNAERRRKAEKAEQELREATAQEIKPGDIITIVTLTQSELEREQLAARTMSSEIETLTTDWTTAYKLLGEQTSTDDGGSGERKKIKELPPHPNLTESDERWFAQGEATREIGGEQIRLVEMRENLGLEPEELEKIEKVFATAPKREIRDTSKEFADALERDLLLAMPEYRDAIELAEKLAKMEEKFEDYYIDIDKGKVSTLATVKNRLLIGIHRTLNKPFRRDYDEYKKLQSRFEARLQDLENLKVFAGKSRANRALDSRLRSVIDDIVSRSRKIRN